MSQDTIVRTSKALYLHECVNDTLADLSSSFNVKFYKIGETSYMLGGLRSLTLSKNNNIDLITIIDSSTNDYNLSSPNNINYRTNDKAVINYLRNHFKDIFANIPKKVFDKLGIKDGATEMFAIKDIYTHDQIKTFVTEAYNYCVNNCATIENKETAQKQEIEKLKNEFVVSQRLIDKTNIIYDTLDQYDKGAKILLIRQFCDTFVTELLTRGFNVYNLIDNSNANIVVSNRFSNKLHVNKNITPGLIDSGEHMKKEIEKLADENFDLIIANPPYSCGSKIIDACRPLNATMVVLAPGSIYSDYQLSTYVSKITTMPDIDFPGATIRDVTIATLMPTTQNKLDYNTEFVMYRYDKDLIPFVKENIKHITNNNRLCSGGDAVKLDQLNIDTQFVVPGRVFDNGVQKRANATDINFNLYFKIVKEKYGCGLLNFSTKKEKLNFATFWYTNPVMQKLIKSVHSSSLRPEINNIIPHINYSVDRDYEHLTIEDLMKILEEES